MNEQIKTIIDRARRLLTGIAGTHVNVTLVGDRIEAHRAFHTQSPAIIGALCDALESAERRAAEAEAPAAAMRAALEQHAEVRRAEHHGELHSARQQADGCMCRWCMTGRALSGDAGRALLDRLTAAEARVADLESVRVEQAAKLRRHLDEIAELSALHSVAEARERRLERELLAIWATVRPGNPAPLTERDVLHAVEDVRRERDALRAAIVEAFEAFNHYSAPHGIQCPAYDDGAEAECDCWLSNTIGPLRSALRGQKLGAPAAENG